MDISGSVLRTYMIGVRTEGKARKFHWKGRVWEDTNTRVPNTTAQSDRTA